MRDLLSLDPPPPVSPAVDDPPYAVLLLSTDNDLSYVLRTLQKRRYAPPTCLAVVLKRMPGATPEADEEAGMTSMMMRLEDVADRVFVWDEAAGMIREAMRAGDGENGHGDRQANGDEDSESEEEEDSEGGEDENAEGATPAGVSEDFQDAQEASESPSPQALPEPASPPPTLTREPSPETHLSPDPHSTVDGQPSLAAPTLAPSRPHTPSKKPPKSSQLVDGVYPHAAAVTNSSLAYHASRPPSRQVSRSASPAPSLSTSLLRLDGSPTTKIASDGGGKSAGAPTQIAIRGASALNPFSNPAGASVGSPTASVGGHCRNSSPSFGAGATAMTGLLSPHAHLRSSFLRSPSLSSSLPTSPLLRSVSSPLAMSAASTPGGSGTGRRAKARERVVSLGMLSPAFERMAETADARRVKENEEAEREWRSGGSWPFPADEAGTEWDGEDDNTIE